MDPRGASGEGAAGILRAVGSLLVALSGASQAQVDRTLAVNNEEPMQPDEPPAEDPAPSRPLPTPPPPVSRAAYPRPQGRPAPSLRASAPPREAQPPARPEPARASLGDTQPGELLDEVEFVLADARERAQRIIDESMERATELIRQERAAAQPVGAIDPRDFDDLRRSLRGLVTEVRDIQQRLARIEQLLRDQNERRDAPRAEAPAPAPVAPAPVGEPAPAEDAAPAEDLAPAWRPLTPEPAYPTDPTYEEPTFEAPAPPAPENVVAFDEPVIEEPIPFPEPDAFVAPNLEPEPEPQAEPEPPAYIPAPAPPRAPFSVVPPQSREWSSATAEEYRDEGESLAPPDAPFVAPYVTETGGWNEPQQDETAADDWPDMPAESLVSASPGTPLATFLPSDGAITLRVAPVAGFQGLMRIQDALTHLPTVRHASVEAYSQGEARLRIELTDPSDSDELAEGLARALRGPAHVEEASEANRELLIALR